jgi:hypothetical protein
MLIEKSFMQSNLNRDELHLLLDHIPDSEVAMARKILRALADPVELALLNAPEDDEPLSAHEQAAWDADQRRRQAGARPITHEELLSDLGISEADLR